MLFLIHSSNYFSWHNTTAVRLEINNENTFGAQKWLWHCYNLTTIFFSQTNDIVNGDDDDDVDVDNMVEDDADGITRF